MRGLILIVAGAFLVLCPVLCDAQKLENIKAEASGDKVIITYDLVTETKEKKFKVELYSSDNNYRSALSLVSGDIGKEVDAGRGKRIEWDAATELKRYQGNITFEIRATLITENVVFQNPEAGEMFRRGKNYQINWAGGEEEIKYDIQLYRNNVRLQSIGNSGGKKNFNWSIPENMKPGAGYEIRLIDNTSNVKGKQEIKIGRKVPLVLKVAPVLVIGAVVGILSGGGGGAGESPTSDELPGPPNPPN